MYFDSFELNEIVGDTFVKKSRYKYLGTAELWPAGEWANVEMLDADDFRQGEVIQIRKEFLRKLKKEVKK